MKVSHSYDDKYYLAETLTSVSIAAQLNALQAMGLHDLSQIKQWATDRSVTLRFNITKQYFSHSHSHFILIHFRSYFYSDALSLIHIR